VTDTVVFQLGKLGQLATNRFADRLAPLGLRPRHCGVLELLRDSPLPQLDLAKQLDVAPSVIVDMLDELEAIGAVRRTRDAVDRRRQLAELTAEGESLSRRVAQLARRVDAEILALLEPAQAATAREVLHRLASAHGIPQ
jgi:DNA-binding MarR family transcriptional regulator